MEGLKRGLDGFQLKLLALAIMTIDHIHYFMPESMGVPYLLTLIGRLAAPVFVFLCVEGFSYTRSRWKYLLRMYSFSVLMKLASMTLNLAVPRPDGVAIMNDIFSTMFVICWCVEGLELLRGADSGKPRWLGALMLGGMLAATAAVIAAMLVPDVPLRLMQAGFLLLPNPFTCEGSYLFVFLGIAFYYTRRSKWKTVLAMAVFSGIQLALVKVTWDLLLYVACTFAAVGLICLYNGKPGKHRCKWLFYSYYPAHAYALYVLGWWFATHT